MLRIRFSRRGKKRHPSYRVVVTERQRSTSGTFIEDLGSYDPRSRQYRLNLDKIQYWISNGARPTLSVAALVKAAGTTPEGERPGREGFAKKNKKQKKAEAEAKAAKAAEEEKKAAEAAAAKEAATVPAEKKA